MQFIINPLMSQSPSNDEDTLRVRTEVTRARGLAAGEKRIQKYIYSMSQILGKGSFAEVFLGRSIVDNSCVAVKVIDRKIFANQYNLKSIQSQIQIMKRMNHKNIVKLLDVFQTNNNLYIVTEHCAGGDLRVLLKHRKCLPQPQAVLILQQLIEAFKYLHSMGFIHRDLKPANILLLSDNTIKVSDFGFAKHLEYGSETIMQSIVGTPLYMSPQLLKQQPYTNKSDLWSVGLVYYQLLHGEIPWPAISQMQLLNNILSKPIVFAAGVSHRSQHFIRACLKRREDERLSWEETFKHPLVCTTETLKERNRSNSKFTRGRSKSGYPKDCSKDKNNLTRDYKEHNQTRDYKENNREYKELSKEKSTYSKSPLSRTQRNIKELLSNRNITPDKKWRI